MPRIHATAIIEGGVQIGADVEVGPWSYLRGHVVLGDGARVGAQCEIDGSIGVKVGAGAEIESGARLLGDIVIDSEAKIERQALITGRLRLGRAARIGPMSCICGNVEIGEETRVYNHSSFGNSAQDPGHPIPQGRIVIGKRNIIREFCTIHLPAILAETRLGDECYIMSSCHVNHDSQIGRGVKMATGTALGGFAIIDDYAYLGINSIIHQRVFVGAYTMIGMNSSITRHVPPFALTIGTSFSRVNRFGLERHGFTDADIAQVEHYYADGGKTRVENDHLRAYLERFAVEHTSKVMVPKFGGANL